MSYRCRSEWLKSLQEEIRKSNNSSSSGTNARVTSVPPASIERTFKGPKSEKCWVKADSLGILSDADRVRNWLENVEPPESPCPSLDTSAMDGLSLFGIQADNQARTTVPPPSPQSTSPANKVLVVSENGQRALAPKQKGAGKEWLVKRKLAFNSGPNVKSLNSGPNVKSLVVNEVEKPLSASEIEVKSVENVHHTANRSERGLKRKLPFSPVKQHLNNSASKSQYVQQELHSKKAASVGEFTTATTQENGLPTPYPSSNPTPTPRTPKQQVNHEADPECENTFPTPPTPLPRRRKHQTVIGASPTDSSPDFVHPHGSPLTPTPAPRKSLSNQGVESMRSMSDLSTLSQSPNTTCLPPKPIPSPRTRKEQFIHHAAEPIMAITPPTPRPRSSLQSPILVVDESDVMILPLVGDMDNQISSTSLSNNNSSQQIIISDGIAIVPPSVQETPIDIPFNPEVENAEGSLIAEDDEILAVPLPDVFLDPVTPQKNNSRKRVKRLSKQDQAKEALNRGLEHLNVKGKLIRARNMGEGCSANCRLKCHSKISKTQRENIFKTYWALGNRQRQDDFLRECIIVTVPKVHKRGEEVKLKAHTIKYFFKFQGVGQVFVCKTMFLGTLGITESPVRTQVKKLERGIAGSPDKRGRHAKVHPEVRKKNDDNIEEHIQLFKTVPSHFCRLRSKRKYLSASLTVRHMWRLYKQWMIKNHPHDQVKSEKYYRNIFNTRFNLGFHKPKKDRCDFCLVYEIGTAAQRRKMKTKYDEHLRNKLNAHKARKEDKLFAKRNKGTTAFCMMDLQQVISLPKTEAGMVFYKRKFSVYNFTIYDGIRKKGYCYLWDESEAKRGANEIATCVLLFIMHMVKEGISLFIFWSDNCGGQNKNMYLFAMYSWAAAKFKIKIIHRYMERGHTMNEADSMHATVGRAARYEQIFEPKDLVPIITNAKRRGKKYDVEMVGSKILDFHPLAENCQNWKKKNAMWNKVREITIDSEKPGKVFVKHDLSSEEPLEIKITKVGRQVNLATYEFPKAYNGPLTLKATKLKDLAQLCNELVIPSSHHGFYKNLINFPDLNSPFLVDSDTESQEENEDQNAADFCMDSEREDEADTDFEEELRIARAAKCVDNHEGEREASDGEDGATDSEEEEGSDGVVYDEDGSSSSEEEG